jgi:hypothetical protein
MWDVKVGDKVCCIKTYNGRQEIVRPVVGHVYTIREVVIADICKEVCFKLIEIPDQSGISYITAEPITVVWYKNWFRPVNNIDKGMETLRGILKDPNQKIKGFEQAKNRKKAKVRS